MAVVIVGLEELERLLLWNEYARSSGRYLVDELDEKLVADLEQQRRIMRVYFEQEKPLSSEEISAYIEYLSFANSKAEKF